MDIWNCSVIIQAFHYIPIYSINLLSYLLVSLSISSSISIHARSHSVTSFFICLWMLIVLSFQPSALYIFLPSPFFLHLKILPPICLALDFACLLFSLGPKKRNLKTFSTNDIMDKKWTVASQHKQGALSVIHSFTMSHRPLCPRKWL